MIELNSAMWWAADLELFAHRFAEIKRQVVEQYPQHVNWRLHHDASTPYFNLGLAEWTKVKREILTCGF